MLCWKHRCLVLFCLIGSALSVHINKNILVDSPQKGTPTNVQTSSASSTRDPGRSSMSSFRLAPRHQKGQILIGAKSSFSFKVPTYQRSSLRQLSKGVKDRNIQQSSKTKPNLRYKIDKNEVRNQVLTEKNSEIRQNVSVMKKESSDKKYIVNRQKESELKNSPSIAEKPKSVKIENDFKANKNKQVKLFSLQQEIMMAKKEESAPSVARKETDNKVSQTIKQNLKNKTEHGMIKMQISKNQDVQSNTNKVDDLINKQNVHLNVIKEEISNAEKLLPVRKIPPNTVKRVRKIKIIKRTWIEPHIKEKIRAMNNLDEPAFREQATLQPGVGQQTGQEKPLVVKTGGKENRIKDNRIKTSEFHQQRMSVQQLNTKSVQNGAQNTKPQTNFDTNVQNMQNELQQQKPQTVKIPETASNNKPYQVLERNSDNPPSLDTFVKKMTDTKTVSTIGAKTEHNVQVETGLLQNVGKQTFQNQNAIKNGLQQNIDMAVNGQSAHNGQTFKEPRRQRGQVSDTSKSLNSIQSVIQDALIPDTLQEIVPNIKNKIGFKAAGKQENGLGEPVGTGQQRRWPPADNINGARGIAAAMKKMENKASMNSENSLPGPASTKKDKGMFVVTKNTLMSQMPITSIISGQNDNMVSSNNARAVSGRIRKNVSPPLFQRKNAFQNNLYINELGLQFPQRRMQPRNRFVNINQRNMKNNLVQNTNTDFGRQFVQQRKQMPLPRQQGNAFINQTPTRQFNGNAKLNFAQSTNPQQQWNPQTRIINSQGPPLPPGVPLPPGAQGGRIPMPPGSPGGRIPMPPGVNIPPPQNPMQRLPPNGGFQLPPNARGSFRNSRPIPPPAQQFQPRNRQPFPSNGGQPLPLRPQLPPGIPTPPGGIQQPLPNRNGRKLAAPHRPLGPNKSVKKQRPPKKKVPNKPQPKKQTPKKAPPKKKEGAGPDSETVKPKPKSTAQKRRPPVNRDRERRKNRKVFKNNYMNERRFDNPFYEFAVELERVYNALADPFAPDSMSVLSNAFEFK